MNADKLQRLEKSKKFKKRFYNKEVWRNYAIIPPSMVLFVSLFGILYLLNLDRLVSIYAIPCVIFLILGTMWLKAVRRYILTQKISEDKVFLICLSIPLVQNNGKGIAVFSVGNNRHNKGYLEKKRKEIFDSISLDSDLTSKSGLQLIPNTDIYIVIPSFVDRVRNRLKKDTVRYVVFNDSNKVKDIKIRNWSVFLDGKC